MPFQKCIDKAAVVVISTRMKLPQPNSTIKIPKPPSLTGFSSSSRCKKNGNQKHYSSIQPTPFTLDDECDATEVDEGEH